MKKIAFILFILIAFYTQKEVKSQDIPPPNPDLAINIVSGHSIVFLFDDMNEYMNGIMNAGQVTYVRVLSVTDWQLQFKADQAMFYGTFDASNTMPLNNVGVIVTSVGTNLDDGSNIVNNAKNLPLALESSDVLLLTKGSLTNKGGGLRNTFTFDWECGTMRGNMNPLSILEQHLGSDTYNLNVVLTLTPVF